MPVDPQFQPLLEALAGMPGVETMTPEQGRALMKTMTGPPSEAPIAGKKDMHIPGPAGEIPLRVYTPVGNGTFPVLMFFHGGGWVLGDLDGYDALCQELCSRAGAVVVSVDYRLAPEHKFPAAPDDCIASTLWVSKNSSALNGDAKRIIVAGDSAGGNLAAVVAQNLKGHAGLVGQLLIYPAVQHASVPSPSMKENGTGYLLTENAIVWFCNHYLNSDDEKTNPKAMPINATSLAGLAPAYVLTAEFDPLRDEGEAYAARLKKDGVPTEFKRYNGAIHGFFAITALPFTRDAINEACQWLSRRFKQQ